MIRKRFLAFVLALLSVMFYQNVYAVDYKPYFRHYAPAGTTSIGVIPGQDPQAICEALYQTYPFQRTITPLNPVTNSLSCTGSKHPTNPSGVFKGAIGVRSEYRCDCAAGDRAFPGGAGFTPACFGYGPEVVCRTSRTCPAGKSIDARIGQCVVTGDLDNTVADKTPVDSESPGTCIPIKYATGNKVLTEQDYAFDSNIGPNYIRSYNAQLGVGVLSGVNWLAGQLSQVYTAQGVSSVGNEAIVIRPDGMRLPFTFDGTVWVADDDITDVLVELKDVATDIRLGWTYAVDDNSHTEAYNQFGQLTTITDRAGFTQTVTHSTPRLGSLTSVTGPLDRRLSFSYTSLGRISTMTNPAGGVYTYAYSTDGNNNLVSVTYPDATVKTYHYEDTTHVNALTGVTDENGSRYMTYTYDANGRAIDEISPTFGTDVNHYALNYNPGVSTIVTDPRGTNRTYNFTTILGVFKSTGTDQPAGAGCAASGSNLTYDVNGNIATRNDFNGNQTAYVYDMARNLETSRSEGLTTAGAATAETRTVATTWHATWRLPLTISEYAGATATGTALKVTTYVYDDKGNITSLSIADPINNKTRTTSTSYTYSSAVPGLVLTKVIDGPRADVSDITTYSYYPHDATCAASTAAPIIDPITSIAPDNLGCRGQLQSISNALNQTSTYDRYNHHGQVEQMTDANGLITTSTYDLRQRITNRTVGTEATNFQYDNVGQLTQLTLPDNSSLAYTYDAAHRLTDITDNLGNKVHYTLDTQGNRINEDTTDPTNQLTKTLSRGYDALNRLEQLTGVE